MKYGSICSGIEAATVAWHPLGWSPVFFSEIEKFPCGVLNHHYPSVPNLGDMTKYKEWPDANIDVLVGGPPCQSFSVAGLRKGLDDPRGNLTLTFLAIVDRFRPKWVVWENVPGVLSDKSNAFGQFLCGLAECGYGYAYRVLDAQYFGVPQRRRRVFVVGHLGAWQPAAAVLFERHSLQGHTAPSREAGQGVAGTVAARTSGGGGLGTDFDLAGVLQPVNFGADGRSKYKASASASALRACGSKQTDVDLIFDMRGNGDGETVNYLTGDHASRPTDYTPIVCMAHGQAGAEVISDGSPSLTCNHEAPIVFGLPGNWVGRKPENGGNATAPMLNVSPSLTSADRHAVAFDCKASGRNGFGVGDVSPTLRAMNSNKSHQNAGGAVAVCFKGGQGAKARSLGLAEEQAPTLGAAQSGSQLSPVVAFAQNTRDEVREMQVCGALAAEPGMKQQSYIRSDMQVRRLTPRECARLQGFPGDYLEVQYANATEAHAAQILHELWKKTFKIAREGWRPGIITALFTEEILLSGVYVGWLSWTVARQCVETRRALSGESDWSEGFLRELQKAEENRYSPYQRESFRQFSREFKKPLQELSLERTQAATILLNSRLWEEAQRTWPLRYALAKNPKKMNPDGPRYKALGNSMAVPVMKWIGERIQAVDNILRQGER